MLIRFSAPGVFEVPAEARCLNNKRPKMLVSIKHDSSDVLGKAQRSFELE